MLVAVVAIQEYILKLLFLLPDKCQWTKKVEAFLLSTSHMFTTFSSYLMFSPVLRGLGHYRSLQLVCLFGSSFSVIDLLLEKAHIPTLIYAADIYLRSQLT